MTQTTKTYWAGYTWKGDKYPGWTGVGRLAIYKNKYGAVADGWEEIRKIKISEVKR